MIVLNSSPCKYVSAAMDRTTDKQEEYTAAIYGCSALGYMASNMTADAMDMVADKIPELLTDRRTRRHINALTGTKSRAGEIALLNVNIGLSLVHREDRPWMADYGNSLHAIMEQDLNRLRVATSNFLGRFAREVKDPTTVAMVLNAQWLAAEATAFCCRKARELSGYSIRRFSGGRENAGTMIRWLSCHSIEYHLRELCHVMVSGIKEDVDLLADPTIHTGCEAFLIRIGSTKTWEECINRADRLNGRVHNRKS